MGKMIDYVCDECGAVYYTRASECCDECLLKFFTMDVNAPRLEEATNE